MATMYQRVRLLKLISKCLGGGITSRKYIAQMIERINSQTIVFFCKHNDLSVMNKAVLYVRENEQSSLLTLVHIIESKEADAAEADTDPFDAKMFHENVAMLDNMYPKIKLNSLIVNGGTFNSGMIAYLSEVLCIPQNYMFIASPNKLDLKNMGGVRVVTH
jgi:hypothetical protein